MVKAKKQKKGGIGVKKRGVFADITRAKALNLFLGGSTFKILTNSSLSAITLLAELDPKYDTPFFSMRSTNLNTDVRKILLKIIITKEGFALKDQQLLPIAGRGSYNGILMQSIDSFHSEVDIQKIIYKRSFSEAEFNSPFDGLCPAIIATMPHLVQNDKFNLIKKILGSLVARGGKKTLENDNKEVASIFNYTLPALKPEYANNSFSIIAMEFMDGYQIVADAMDKELITGSHKHMISYAFDQLHTMGYLHGDAHFANMMINLNEPFFSTKNLGRIILIDFGRTRFFTPSEKLLNKDRKLQLERFYKPTTWPQFTDDIYKILVGKREAQVAALTTKMKASVPGLWYPGAETIYDVIQGLIDPSKEEKYLLTTGGAGDEEESNVEEIKERINEQLNMHDEDDVEDEDEDEDEDKKKNEVEVEDENEKEKEGKEIFDFTEGGKKNRKRNRKRKTKKTKKTKKNKKGKTNKRKN